MKQYERATAAAAVAEPQLHAGKLRVRAAVGICHVLLREFTRHAQLAAGDACANRADSDTGLRYALPDGRRILDHWIGQYAQAVDFHLAGIAGAHVQLTGDDNLADRLLGLLARPQR